jgi:multiple sugar transport system substrate-binding protein
MNFSKSFLRGVAALTLIPLLGLGCKNTIPAGADKPIRLVMWGVFDTDSDYAGVIAAYRAEHPNISIEYVKYRVEEYDTQLLNAFAEDRGPDIFMVHNTAVQKWLPKIVPLPPSITLPVWTTSGTIKKETTVTMVATRSMSASDMARMFPDVVVKDAVVPTLVDEATGTKADRIYGIPTSIDTLALYTNRDLLSAAGIPEPPKDWTTFSADVEKLTKLSTDGAILQSGAALGTSNNIERPSDVLSLLMMQSGAQMTDEFGNATFEQVPAGGNSDNPPAVMATRFYTDFANPTRKSYTWSSAMPNSFEAFATGKTAMMLGYNYHLPLLKARAPKLNFDVSTVPQLQTGGGISFANYWLNTVSKKSKSPGAAWSFVQFLADPTHVTPYLKATGKPPALKTLAAASTEDALLSVWNSQVMTSKSWYHGLNSPAADDALKTLIDVFLAGNIEKPLLPVQEASAKITQTMR